MPKVGCINLGGGYDVWFRSNDHLPPHFHVEKVATWEIRVFFRRPAKTMIEVIWGKGPMGKERRAIVAQVESRRLLLEEE